MIEDALWLDGNGIAGLLCEIFDADMTTVPRACQSCGAISAIGAHRAYRSAGVVLRCPACGDLALKVAILPDRYIVRLAGTWEMSIERVSA